MFNLAPASEPSPKGRGATARLGALPAVLSCFKAICINDRENESGRSSPRADPFLQSRRVVTAEQMAAHFELSVRTIYRDLVAPWASRRADRGRGRRGLHADARLPSPARQFHDRGSQRARHRWVARRAVRRCGGESADALRALEGPSGSSTRSPGANRAAGARARDDRQRANRPRRPIFPCSSRLSRTGGSCVSATKAQERPRRRSASPSHSA